MIANDKSDVVLFNASVNGEGQMLAEMAFVDVGVSEIVSLQFNGNRYKVRLPATLANKYSSQLAFDLAVEILAITPLPESR